MLSASVLGTLALAPLTEASAGAPSRDDGDGVIGLPAWGVVKVARTARTSETWLNGVKSFGPMDGWAVGTAAGSTLTERWNGERFVVVPSPNRRGCTNFLEAVDGVSPTDVWAVGHADVPNFVGSTSLIEHWDGTAWRIVKSPSDGVMAHANDLTGVVAVSATNVWAVGTLKRSSRGVTLYDPIVLHWDGERWRRAPNGCADGLAKVDARSASDIWAVGGSQTCHFDGSSWTNVPAAAPGPGYSLQLTDVTVVSASDVWAVGGETIVCGPEGEVCSGGAIEHWDGTKWTYVTSIDAVLSGVDSAARDDIYAVGIGSLGPTILHFDGSAWQDVPNILSATDRLRAVDLAGVDAWAVGGPGFAERAPSPTSGAVVGETHVANATVSWFGKESGSVETDSFGSYRVGALTAGRYTFTVTLAGCEPGSLTVRVEAGTTIGRNLHPSC